MASFWSELGSKIGSLLLAITILQKAIPQSLQDKIDNLFNKFWSFFYPYVDITFDEYNGYCRNKAFTNIETYLGTNFSSKAERLKATTSQGNRVSLKMDDYEEIVDTYQGITVWWMVSKTFPRSNVISLNHREEERKYYTLTFPNRHRDLITGPYLEHVMTQGKAIKKSKTKQMLYTNVSQDDDWRKYNKEMWSNISFEHPSTFETLAMDDDKKKKIMDDLDTFTKSREYYKEIGKAWKRGYLLYGPPGTGKSSMIAAIANYLHYDVYDLELTAVEDNTELRKILMEVSKRAVVVIEDIDCSLDLTAKRTPSPSKKSEGQPWKKLFGKKKSSGDDSEDSKESKVTLSGLLNAIDGLWSACGGERIIIFTTNHVDELDPALIRTGRMDLHIEMSYCTFKAFKVLAKNYLKIESHDMFSRIESLLQEVEMTPADVGEKLMPKSAEMNAEVCLQNLANALQKAKEAKMSDQQQQKQTQSKTSMFKRKVRSLLFWKKRRVSPCDDDDDKDQAN